MINLSSLLFIPDNLSYVGLSTNYDIMFITYCYLVHFFIKTFIPNLGIKYFSFTLILIQDYIKKF